ncbi:hypothetical protein [Verrucomicrobium spinosum]|nr:hypothetical protein [Verrucomicrobium spinosum]
MMKPHTSLPFFAMLVAKRRWYACFVGAVLLGALGWGVSSFTGHTLLEVLYASYGQSPMTYASIGDTLVQPLMSLLGIGHRPAVLITALLAMGLLLPFVFRPLASLPSLVHLAAAGVAGRLGFYHRHYDDVMLAFLLLALTEEALRSRGTAAWMMLAITGLTLWVPYPLLAQFSGTSWRIVIWASALVYLTRTALKRVSVSTNSAPGEQVSVG